MSIHTNLLWKKFPDSLSLYLTMQGAKSHRRKALLVIKSLNVTDL